MSERERTCPLTRQQIVDRYFLENRARLLDLAAFFDRLERAADGPGPDDFRVAALRAGIRLLLDGQPERAKRIQLLLSDPTHEPRRELRGKGAVGAYDPATAEGD